MDATVKNQGVLKNCLRLHAATFFTYALSMELIPQILASALGGELFTADANTYILQAASADMFFVCGATFLSMSMQETLPRWTTWVPLLQAIYNVVNDIRWSQENIVPGGKAAPYRFLVTDGGIFASLFISYIYAYVNASVVNDTKKNV